MLFLCLAGHGVVINTMKSQLGEQQLEFLGHLVHPSVIKPLPDIVCAINDFPLPKSVTKLREFLGFIDLAVN